MFQFLFKMKGYQGERKHPSPLPTPRQPFQTEHINSQSQSLYSAQLAPQIEMETKQRHLRLEIILAHKATNSQQQIRQN